MAFKCKRKISKSKRKCVSCKGCKYLQKNSDPYNKQKRFRCTC